MTSSEGSHAGEGWPSGLRRRPAKALDASPRGFESHSLRYVWSPAHDAGGTGPGRVAERLKAHDWKSCGLTAHVGSNPTPSVFPSSSTVQ